MKGFYAEMRDEKNAGKTGDEIKAMVVKNLAKDPLFYTKDGMFGVKGVGYTTEAPGLGEPKEPKGKHKASGYGDLDTEVKIKEPKSNVQDSLGDQEAETTMPKKVKEMPDKGVTGVEKRIKLKENIQDRADAINDFARLVKTGTNDEIANTFENNRDYETTIKVSEMIKILKKYGKYDDIMSMIDDDFTDPAGGRGLSSHLEEKIGMFNDPIGYKKSGLSDIDKMFTKELQKDNTYTIYKNGKIVKTGIEGTGNANAWINDEMRKLKEAMDQGPVSIKGKTGPTGGTQKIPRALFLDKEVISTINDAQPGSIKLISKPGDKRVYMYVSSFVKNALDELERGRSSREKLKKQSKLADVLADKLPSAIRGKIKKEINPKMDSGLKMHYVDLNISPKKDKTGYWVLAKGESAPLVAEQKLRSLIRNLIKEELVNEISPELFKRATDVSRERGQDRRTMNMGETFFNKFKGRPLMGSTIADVSYAKPQSGDYEEVIVKIEVPSSVVPGETKFRFIYYDVRKDQWGVDKEITRADARILSLIAQHINPDTRYKSGGEGFQIKGY